MGNSFSTAATYLPFMQYTDNTKTPLWLSMFLFLSKDEHRLPDAKRDVKAALKRYYHDLIKGQDTTQAIANIRIQHDKYHALKVAYDITDIYEIISNAISSERLNTELWSNRLHSKELTPEHLELLKSFVLTMHSIEIQFLGTEPVFKDGKHRPQYKFMLVKEAK